MKQYEKKGFNVEQALKFVKIHYDGECSLCEIFEYCHKLEHADCIGACIQYLMSEVPDNLKGENEKC